MSTVVFCLCPCGLGQYFDRLINWIGLYRQLPFVPSYCPSSAHTFFCQQLLLPVWCSSQSVIVIAFDPPCLLTAS